MNGNTSNLCLMTGNANPELAKKIADRVGVELVDTFVGRFNNGETQVMINRSIRGKDIFIVNSTSQPVNDNLMDLLIMADACKRASAHSITAVVPYYAYARQDRKTRGREPISAKLVANLIVAAGMTRVLTVDLHAGQIQGFFDIPVDHLRAAPIFADYFNSQNFGEDLVVVSPDLGGVTRARKLADYVKAPIAIIEKRRPRPGEAEVMSIIGDVQGKVALMIDDIVDTAGSLCEGAKSLKRLGAKKVIAACTHAVLSNNAVEKINNSDIEQLVITDTIALPPEKQSPKITVLSMAEAIGDVILSIQSHRSVSLLFK
ncbi:MAG: ribose-phosphate pyrophosphokinase [Quinella sp. 3Q1]|nr:ribose-phosphate pyrophosphokinase [Quinella sp. 3Q1]MBR3050554.1 ribose-phosphate pyrophosphokinase [Selenomonadaceae bacterium]